ncbi:MAG: hypothetical protein M3N22_05400 [Acidobacteriota bacterium]|nr:hypothetical protein [Acidobacteriota bacterium]
MRRSAITIVTFLAVLITSGLSDGIFAQSDKSKGAEVILKTSDISSKLLPEAVFFRGQVAPTQLRNSGGVRYADDFYMLVSLVDNSGYSTAIREKYQAYLLTEVTLDFGGQTLQPGAYGCGFINGGKFVVMDLGAHDVFQTSSQRDAEIKRPVPLQIIASSTPATYRLYAGRDFVEFHRAK